MRNFKTISCAEAKQLQAENSVFIDVREPAEFRACHIANAKLIPLGQINAEKISMHQSQNLIIYCQKGVRGNKACQKLIKQNNQLKLFNIEGGIDAWLAVNYPTQQEPSNVLALDRQVQITIGIMVLLFSLLGYFYSPSFNFAAAFIGIGLIFAGISGFCGLARILALAPWNK